MVTRYPRIDTHAHMHTVHAQAHDTHTLHTTFNPKHTPCSFHRNKKETFFVSVDNSTQTREADITIFERGSENKLSYSTRDLPHINYYQNHEISDPRNEDMARIMLYELERLHENHRITAFMAMFNELIKKKREFSCSAVAASTKNSEIKLSVMKNLKRLHDGDNDVEQL
jgi:hypothetical protein